LGWLLGNPGLSLLRVRHTMHWIAARSILIMLGMDFCYYVVLRTVFHFIANFAPESITPAPDIEAYLSFVMTMFIAFGVTFEVPIAVILLVKSGIVTVQKLRSARGYVIVGAFIIAAVVTPPDVVSQFMLAVPLCLLFELGVLVASALKKNEAPTHEDEDDLDTDEIAPRND